MKSIQTCVLVLILLLGLANSGLAQTDPCPEPMRVAVLYVPEGMCAEGAAVEWRVMLGGQTPWGAGALWITPATYCLGVSQAMWDYWAKGWFENRCIATDGRPPSGWYPVQEPRIGSWLDIRCTNDELNPPMYRTGAQQ